MLTFKRIMTYVDRSEDELSRLNTWQSYCVTYNPRSLFWGRGIRSKAIRPMRFLEGSEG